MKVLSRDYCVSYRNYGDVVVPEGTPVNSQTAGGYDPRYNFVSDFTWAGDTNSLFVHDLIHYGLDVPEEYLEVVE